jgi:predicted transcriptional regulator
MYTQRNDRQTGGGAVWLMFFLAVIGVALFLCLTGCASKSYVDWNDTAGRHLSRMEFIETYADLSEPVVDKLIELDNRVRRLEKHHDNLKKEMP